MTIRHSDTNERHRIIRKLKEEGNSNTKIAEVTGIPRRTVQDYVKKIHELDKTTWEDVSKESVESRAIIIKETYEKIIKKAEAIVDDPETKAKDLEIASKLLIGSHINIYNMLKDGPLSIPVINSKALPDKTNDVI